MARHRRIWLLGGPTAAGKSALAVRLARACDGEIVNADSMQLYADLAILSGRPTPAERGGIAHHLFGVADAAEAWSVGRWLAAAQPIVADIQARGRQPIVVGGTGLYFRALTDGLAAIPAVPATVRERVQHDYDRQGEDQIRRRLAAVDPAAAARIAPADRQRLTRALEVFEASGRPLTDWQADTRPAAPADGWRGAVVDLERASLYARIGARLEGMAAAGAVDEVRRLLARQLDPRLPALKALGLRSFAAELAGALTAAQALEEAKRETRRYAKRQMTWFAHQRPGWPRLAPDITVEAALEVYLA